MDSGAAVASAATSASGAVASAVSFAKGVCFVGPLRLL